jgi:peptide/nickel transport system permease protein
MRWHLLQQRLLLSIPMLLLVSIIIFMIVRALPGDAALVRLMAGGEGRASAEELAALRHELGLDQPLPIQYGQWLLQLARLDFGTSFTTGRPVLTELGERLPRTIELAVLAMLVATVIAIPSGIVAALHRGSPIDQALRLLAVGGVAMPNFWVAALIILALVGFFHWLPQIGYVDLWRSPGTNLQQVIFPVLVLGYRAAAVLMRITRSSMLEVLSQDYVRTARAKGLGESRVLLIHALRNALLAVLAVGGVEFVALLGGSVVAETIFVIPGIGSLLVQSVQRRDYFVTEGAILLFAVLVVMVNLIIDVVQVWLNPRTQYH